MLLVVLVLSFTSCDWDNSPEPDHPTYVSYTVSAWQESYEGPTILASDIADWIKTNTVIHEERVNSTTGALSEFAKTDPTIYPYYDTFKSKFTNYLNSTVKSRLANGDYGKNVTVQATYYVYANRAYGEGKELKSEKVTLSYP